MLQPDPSSASQHPGARCAEHVDRPATTICARCGSYACVLCRHQGPEGQEYCERCLPTLSPVLAEPGTRFVANLVDSFAIILPMSVFLGGMLSAVPGNGTAALSGILVILGVLTGLVLICYQLQLLSEIGQTLGKRMMGIKVVRTDGSPVTLGRLLLLRNLVPGAINVACGLFGFIDALFIFAADRRCLHDRIAGTKVVKVIEHPAGQPQLLTKP